MSTGQSSQCKGWAYPEIFGLHWSAQHLVGQGRIVVLNKKSLGSAKLKC